MSHEAVTWAMDDAPMLRTSSGKPDTTARHVLQVLAERADAKGRESFPSVLDIEYRTGYDRRTIQRSLKRLEGARLISKDGQRYGQQNYNLSMELKRPKGDRQALYDAYEMDRKSAAERKRKSRSKASEDSDGDDVTDSECVSHALEVRDVTHFKSVRHALNASHNHPPTPHQPSRTGVGAPEDPSDPQNAAAHGSLRSPRLPSKDEDDHLPAEDPLPAVRTATIPGDERELADVVSIEDRKLAKESHMNSCAACQTGRWQCAEGRSLTLAATGLWNAVPADVKRSAGLL